MRTLIVGALAATLAGCSCFVSPQSGLEACTGADGRGFACLDRNAGGRLGQATEPEPSSFDSSATTPKEKAALAARTAKPSSARSGRTTHHAAKTAKSASTTTTATTATVEPAAAAQPPEAIDPVIDKAKIAVAVKLDNPASAAFGDMNRAMRKNTLGQSVDTICGHVKGKKASGEDIGDTAFLYLVKDDEAYVVDGSPTSASSTAYRNICN
jgi:hypothetical protein